MLVAGAGADGIYSVGGALTFDVNASPLGAWWLIGSAEKTYRSILFLV